MEAINSLKLEAIFYPKFDNDKQQKSSQGASSAQQSVRTTMVQALDAANENEHNTSDSDSKVYLEASLKHSGSLLLWSGGDSRFYAKNSMDNVFSLTGEMLLRQHFARVQLAGNMNTNTRSDETNSNSNKRKLNGTYDSEEMYRACSAEVQRRRLCLSFECVTAVLGDHGDVPKRDYLILTAVADMNQECFFSTHDLVKFAQQWRLPHNDVWLFANRESAEALFRFYDNSRETAFAKAVVQALDEIASVSIKSMLPHVDFQGDILEGLVVRLVKQNRHKDGNGGDDDIHILSRMQQLALDSREILNDVPPQVPPFPQSSQCHDSCNVGALCTDIREFSARFGRRRTATGSDPGEKENELRRLIGNQRKVVRASRSEIGKKAAANGPSSEVNDLDFVRLVKDLLRRHASASLGDGHAFDSETIRIAGLVQSLERQHLPINFKCHEVSCGVDENGHKKSDFICIIHVKADSVFPQYYRNKAAADMDLFRGFSIRINANRNGNGRFTPPAPNMSREQAIDVTKSGEALMLKLKFLPYMVRTFGCRNGLSTLAKHGPEAFNDYVANLLRKWGISVAGSEKWMSFFRAWGEYAYPKVVVKDKLHEDAQITSSSYLNHLQNFSDMYHSNALKSSNEKSYEDKFRGIVAIVGVDASCHYVAESIASSLGSFFVRNVKKLTPEKVIMARGVNGRGLVCACNVKDGPGKIRKLLPKHQEALCIVLLGCGNKEFTHSTTAMNAKERKKMLGMLNSWKMTRVKRTFDITLTAIGSKEKHQNSSAYKDLLNELRSFSQAIPKPDNRSGMLVFFPGIPGSGKTCLTKIIDSYQASKDGAGMKLSEIHISDDRTSNEADAKIEEKIEALISSKRSIIVRCSDAVKTKYWPLVREEKYEEPSAIYIADKNATSIVWDTIGSICTGSRSIAVPILPAVPALKVTEIIGGSDCVKLGKASDMDFDLPQSTSPTHIYPFSLHYLAVCMSRVLLRSPGTHVGRLDSGTAEACMVVVKFFCLYRHLSPDTFLEKMLRRVTNESIATEVQPVINVPFFKDKNLPDLPTDLEEALVDALRVQYDIDKLDKTGGSTVTVGALKTAVEAHLRKVITLHRDFLQSLEVSESISQHSFLEQLKKFSSSLDDLNYYPSNSTGSTSSKSKRIQLVAVNVEFSDIQKLLIARGKEDLALAKYIENDPIAAFMKTGKVNDAGGSSSEISSNNRGHGTDKAGRCITKTHITMDHGAGCTQAHMKEKFKDFEGSSVPIEALSILIGKNAVAVEVRLPEMVSSKTNGDEKILPTSTNEFQHITIWCRDKSVASNKLPHEVEQGEAEKIVFAKSTLNGILEFWYED